MLNLRKHLMEKGKGRSGLIQVYRAAAQRALLLDYDGPLVPFVEDPKLARPDQEVLGLLGGLAAGAGIEVVIISGRPRRDLEKWFGAIPVALVAEHGVWLRSKGGGWRMLKALTTEWKERVRPILQTHVERLRGALAQTASPFYLNSQVAVRRVLRELVNVTSAEVAESASGANNKP